MTQKRRLMPRQGGVESGKVGVSIGAEDGVVRYGLLYFKPRQLRTGFLLGEFLAALEGGEGEAKVVIAVLDDFLEALDC